MGVGRPASAWPNAALESWPTGGKWSAQGPDKGLAVTLAHNTAPACSCWCVCGGRTGAGGGRVLGFFPKTNSEIGFSFGRSIGSLFAERGHEEEMVNGGGSDGMNFDGRPQRRHGQGRGFGTLLGEGRGVGRRGPCMELDGFGGGSADGERDIRLMAGDRGHADAPPRPKRPCAPSVPLSASATSLHEVC